MSGFRGGRKYLIYIFIAGWMFFLGILTGRGTIPVKFDTVKFSDRLAAIAESLTKGKKSNKKLKLNFYQGLVDDLLIIKPKEPDAAIPIKINKAGKPTPTPDPKPKPAPKPELKKQLKNGNDQQKTLYTLQVAAYQSYNEAAAKIADLKEMGFGSHHEKTQKNGKLWYRVRIGTFPSFKHANIAKNLLNKASIDSIIMKKD
jgi:septal ring-binding cell division protein DamX